MYRKGLAVIYPITDIQARQLEVRQKYSAARRIFNSLLGVWKCAQTRSFVFDILRQPALRLVARPPCKAASFVNFSSLRCNTIKMVLT